MADEYNIELTDSTPLATIEALEVDGGTSTGRNILVVDTTGGAGTNFFEISGDLTARYVAGFTFEVVGSATNDATYTVVGAGSSFVGGNTRIQVNQAITDDDSVLPLGSTRYDLLDIGGTNTRNAPVELPGRGVVNYGEFILEDLLHMTEHFASAEGAPGIPDFTLVPNRLESPLVGQLWYNRTNESLYRFTGPDPAVDWALGAAMGICDADNDTCVLTEEAPDEDIIRFDTGDTPVGYPAITDIMTLASSGWNVSMGTANVPTTVGAPISLTAGTGGLTSAGGVLNLTAGAGGATSGFGGFVNINAGAAQTSGNGGDINLVSGAGAGGFRGGDMFLRSGVATVTGAGGQLNVIAGDGGATSGNGGDVHIDGGNAPTDGNGGEVLITGGDGAGTGVLTFGGRIRLDSGASGADSNGAPITLTAGDAGAGAYQVGGSLYGVSGAGSGGGFGGPIGFLGGDGGATGAGADVMLYAGDGGATSGPGGVVRIDGGLAADGVGGDVDIEAGTSGGANAGGGLNLTSGNAGTVAAGGNILVNAGAGGSVSGTGGIIALYAGDATAGTSQGGTVRLTAGDSSGGAGGGPVEINSGDGGATAGPGGLVNITAGFGGLGANGGAISLTSGPGTTSGNGGVLELRAGLAGVTGDGGNVTVTAGNGGATSGDGGSIDITPGSQIVGSVGTINLLPPDTGAGETAELRFHELDASGAAYVGFKSPDDLTVGAGAQTYVLPPADGPLPAGGGPHAIVSDGAGNLRFDVPFGAGRFETTFVHADLQAGQIVDVSDDKLAATATGLANDATVYTATIDVDGGGPQAISIVGSSAQTYATLLTELAADTVGAIWSLAGGNLLAVSDTAGGATAIAIVDTDLFLTLTGFITISGTQYLLAVNHALGTKFNHVAVYNQTDELSFIGAVYAVDIDNVQLKLTAAVAADPTPSLDGTWTVVVSQ